MGRRQSANSLANSQATRNNYRGTSEYHANNNNDSSNKKHLRKNIDGNAASTGGNQITHYKLNEPIGVRNNETSPKKRMLRRDADIEEED